MKKIIFALLGLFLLSACGTGEDAVDTRESTTVSNDNSVAIIYYSLTGTTAEVANEIQQKTGGTLIEIATAEPYSDEYSDVTDIVSEQIENDALPDLANIETSLADYDTIYLGSPIWYGSISLPIQKFLTDNDLSGKEVYPFYTSGSSGIDSAVEEVESLASGVNVHAGLGLSENDMDSMEDNVSDWLTGD
ncbi:flavodoxin [Enterococcus alishanensis]|uniref:Flavodoxin-like domain-containing protein n=1 Tax=Enterococcus alishanensis TaxID=1303817 RepID=A0ABS6TDM6_9ENTE|nr:flavodoxin [Enterococcus alishanensis]MBV7390975.1 hypothetical protein [Enterococcus alishanensis]